MPLIKQRFREMKAALLLLNMTENNKISAYKPVNGTFICFSLFVIALRFIK